RMGLWAKLALPRRRFGCRDGTGWSVVRLVPFGAARVLSSVLGGLRAAQEALDEGVNDGVGRRAGVDGRGEAVEQKAVEGVVEEGDLSWATGQTSLGVEGDVASEALSLPGAHRLRQLGVARGLE